MRASMNLEAQAADLDRWIREGKGEQARTRLLELHRKRKISSDHALAFARLAWRLALPELGLHWLGPRVRPGGKRTLLAGAEEKIAYADCLTKVGAPQEAWRLL